jgi:hypothetical protein
METVSKFFAPGIVFLLTLISGFWLSNSGKPLNSLIINIHKLIALGAVVFIILQANNTVKGTGLSGLMIGLSILAGLCVIALFASGAMMSIGKVNYDLMLAIHRASTLLVILALASLIYLLTLRIS